MLSYMTTPVKRRPDQYGGNLEEAQLPETVRPFRRGLPCRAGAENGEINEAYDG